MPAVTVKIVGAQEVHALLDTLGDRWFDAARTEFKDAAARVHRTVSNRVRDGSGDTLHSRTGQLRRSLQFRVYGDALRTLGSEVFSDSSFASYAAVHEFGATIRAKDKYVRVPGGPYLNIPLDVNKTPAGVQRQSAREVFRGGGYIVKSRTGRYLVMSGDHRPMFVLVKQVTIPARLRLHQSAVDEIPTLLGNLARATQGAIEE